MTCARCHQEIEAESSFCRFCGQPASATARPSARLTRLPDDGRIAGVCAGIASYFDADVTLVRLAWAILSIVPGVLIGGVIAYAAAWALMPVAEAHERRAFGGKRLVRSATDRMIAGVCGGIADYVGLDVTLVRLLAVVLAVYPGAVIGGVLMYAAAWFIMPDSPADPRSTESPVAQA